MITTYTTFELSCDDPDCDDTFEIGPGFTRAEVRTAAAGQEGWKYTHLNGHKGDWCLVHSVKST